MRILVTGGLGYIGSHAVLSLLRRKHDVYVYDNLANSSLSVLDRITDFTQQNLNFVNADVRDYDMLCRVFSEFSPNMVMHFAGLKAVGESFNLSTTYYDVNVGGSLNLIKAMNEFECQAIVFSSSATVYGHPKQLPIPETHSLSPTNPYGNTKRLVEDMISDWGMSGQGRRAVLLRYFNPAGAEPTSIIGENPSGTPNNLFPFVAQVASRDRDKLHVWGNDYATSDGTGVRDYLHVVDLAEAHCDSLEYLQRNESVSTFNLGTGRGYSVLEIIKAFEAASGEKIPFEFAPRRSGDAAEVVADPTLAKNKLGWSAQLTLEDMCRDAWNWQQKCKPSLQ